MGDVCVGRVRVWAVVSALGVHRSNQNIKTRWDSGEAATDSQFNSPRPLPLPSSSSSHSLWDRAHLQKTWSMMPLRA
jgi:hypothetical protein